MSYVIKDGDNWLEVDRVCQGFDIVTVVEPVYNWHVATQFSSKESVNQIIKQIESEGNYNTSNYTTENTIDLEDKEKKEKEELQKQQSAEINKAKKITIDNLKEIIKEMENE